MEVFNCQFKNGRNVMKLNRTGCELVTSCLAVGDQRREIHGGHRGLEVKGFKLFWVMSPYVKLKRFLCVFV